MPMDPTKLLVIAVLALFRVGPEKLPEYAARLARFVRAARGMLDDAKDRVREELGPDFDEEEWRKLDPRQYDPRRIIRDALLEPPPPPPARAPPPRDGARGRAGAGRRAEARAPAARHLRRRGDLIR